MKEVMMKCGHAANSIGSEAGSKVKKPACVICSCFEPATKQPKLKGRKARCTYYGKAVKTGWYNSNCCSTCTDVCLHEEDSKLGLWFFQQHPDKEYDEFYCACQGAD